MRALTLKQPWLNAILYHGKRVENRSWPWPRTVGLPTWIALHAGSTRDVGAGDALCEELIVQTMGRGQKPQVYPDLGGHILALARVYACVPENDPGLKGNIWAFGPWCFMIGALLDLDDPIEIKGNRGLWRLPSDVKAKLWPYIDKYNSCPACRGTGRLEIFTFKAEGPVFCSCVAGTRARNGE